MAIARKCDRCGKLYEKYDDVECNGMEVNRVLISNGIVNKDAYDLCPECCLEFVRWMTNSATEVREKVETRLFADGEELLTVKPNGEIELANQIQEEEEESEEPEYLYTITNKITGEKTNVYKEGMDDET